MRATRAAVVIPEPDLGGLLDPEISREAWKFADTEKRRAIVELVVTRVEVKKATAGRFKPERVVIT